MAITGACLVLFVTFHVLMNSVALLWPAAYNMVCEFLGANWYALAASAGLAVLFILHIIYAIWLTLQNRRARGNDRYDIAGKAPGVEWSSKNMLVLGFVVILFLGLHLIQFWAKMQLQELISHDLTALPTVEGVPASPAFGTLFLQLAFEWWVTPVAYIIGLIALWFHMNHGFWSMFHTVGWDNGIWLSRLKTISCWWTSIVIGLFIIQVAVFSVQAHNKFFLNDPALQAQYAEFWDAKAQALISEFRAEAAPVQTAGQAEQQQFLATRGDYYAAQAEIIADAVDKQVANPNTEALMSIRPFAQFIKQNSEAAKKAIGASQSVVEEAPAAEETNTNE